MPFDVFNALFTTYTTANYSQSVRK